MGDQEKKNDQKATKDENPIKKIITTELPVKAEIFTKNSKVKKDKSDN